MPPYPGQLRQAAFALISRGAAMIEYWHWHTPALRHRDLLGRRAAAQPRPGRVYEELSELGAELGAIGDQLDGFEPDADVAILWSTDSRFALEFSPAVPDADGSPTARVHAHLRRVPSRRDRCGRAGADPPHRTGARAGAAELAARFPVLVAPAVYTATDADLDLLRDYAAAGGHLVIGIRTGYGDDEARARVAVAPDRLREAAGVHYEEFSNLHDDVAVTGGGSLALRVRDRDAVGRWADQRWRRRARPVPASALLGLPRRHDQRARRRAHHRRRAVPSPALAADLVRWAVPTPSPTGCGASPRPSPSRRACFPTAGARGSSSTGAGTRSDHARPPGRRSHHRRGPRRRAQNSPSPRGRR